MSDDVGKTTSGGRRELPAGPANASIVRDNDAMRTGAAAHLVNVDTGELVLALPEALPLREQIKIRVRNDVQRFEKELRGVVGNCSGGAGAYYVTIELYTRLTPLDVSLLRQGINSAAPSSRPKWL